MKKWIVTEKTKEAYHHLTMLKRETFFLRISDVEHVFMCLLAVLILDLPDEACVVFAPTGGL